MAKDKKSAAPADSAGEKPSADVSTSEGESVPMSIEDLFAAKKALLDQVAAIDSAIDARKREFAEACSRVRILKQKFYTSGACGGFIPASGDTYDRERHAPQFKAIVAQGRAGIDFEFVGDE